MLDKAKKWYKQNWIEVGVVWLFGVVIWAILFFIINIGGIVGGLIDWIMMISGIIYMMFYSNMRNR